MGITVGIDLGTTNSVLAVYKKDNIKVVENKESDTLTPSVVHLTKDGEIIVGKGAKEYAGADPANTIFSIKRFMGRDFSEDAVQQDVNRASFKVVKAENGEVEVILRGRKFTPPEISAFILESMKVDAEEMLSKEITHAVITVPAYFGNRQKEATRLAGDLAGLNVMHILPEPTAAALRYGVNEEEGALVLVYDLGGGTFDVTVMDINAGIFDDIGKSGNMHLGGDDFDQKIMFHVIEQVRISQGVDLYSLKNPEILYKLKKAAEDAKIRLSRQMRTQIVLPGLAKVNNRLIDVEIDLTRETLNRLIQPLVDLSVELVKDAIKKANCSESDIRRVLLVGGSTKVPLVTDTLHRIFGDKVIRGELNPMHCVAEGAAIQTNLPIPPQNRELTNIIECPKCSSRNFKDRADCRRCGAPFKGKQIAVEHEVEAIPGIECPQCGASNDRSSVSCVKCGVPFGQLLQKIPVPIGVEVEGGNLQVVLTDQMYYPTTEPVTKSLRTAMPSQRLARLPIYEGFEQKAKDNTFLGEVVGELPSGLPENTPVLVSLSIDNDGILSVTANLPDRPEVEIKAKLAWKSKPEPVQPTTGTPSGGKDSMPVATSWKDEAQTQLNLLNVVLTEGKDAIAKEDILLMIDLGAKLKQAIDRNDERNGVQLKNQLEEKINKYFIFVILAVGKIVAQDPETSRKIGLEKTNRLADAANRADRYRQAHDWKNMVSTIENDLMPVLNEAIQAEGGLRGDLLGGILRASSSG